MWILTRGKINLSGGGKDKCLGGEMHHKERKWPVGTKRANVTLFLVLSHSLKAQDGYPHA